MDEAPAIRFIGDMQRLELKPGDRYVITVDDYLSAEQYAAIVASFRAFMGDPDARPLVLGRGAKLGVMSDPELPRSYPL